MKAKPLDDKTMGRIYVKAVGGGRVRITMELECSNSVQWITLGPRAIARHIKKLQKAALGGEPALREEPKA